MTDAFICDFCGDAKKGSPNVVVKSKQSRMDWNDLFPEEKNAISGIDGSKDDLDCCIICFEKMIKDFSGVEVNN